MDLSQKAEDLLLLSLDANEKELSSSDFLSAGIEADGMWEIIIKYHGDIFQYATPQIRIEPLQFGYGIVTLPESEIEEFLQHEEVEYAEKPKELYEQDLAGNLASCMNQGTSGGRQALTGKGVCIAVIDSGVDVTLPCFLDENGKSRVLFFYDQVTGREYTGEDIDDYIVALQNSATGNVVETVPQYSAIGNAGESATRNSATGNMSENLISKIVWDETGHGTRVAGIAASNGRQADGSVDNNLVGAAPEASLIVVRLNSRNNQSFPLTTSVMRAFDYVRKKSVQLNLPTVINLSFGNSYGAHDGTSLLESYINEVAQSGRFVICVGAGNEGAAGGHVGGRFLNTDEKKNIYFQIGYYQKECSLQLWFLAVDQYIIRLRSPGGDSVSFETDISTGRSIRVRLQNTDILLYVGTAQPFSMKREIFFSFTGEPYIDAGTWELEMERVYIKSGNYNLYLPGSMARSRDTVFLQPSPELTITIPATAQRVISVGAYQINYRAYAEFSGRGYVAKAADHNLFLVKPEVVAPGVSVLTQTKDGIERVNGTSFATPFVAGAAARLMEDGIVRGNDPYMYGEKCKALLAARATRLPADAQDINDKTGYGALCLNY